MNFKEKLLFELYKDKPIINAKSFKRKIYSIPGIDCNMLYRKVVNYQIEKYGETIDEEQIYSSRADRLKQAQAANVRKHRRG